VTEMIIHIPHFTAVQLAVSLTKLFLFTAVTKRHVLVITDCCIRLCRPGRR